jgi:Tfp pilus assembly protein PilF
MPKHLYKRHELWVCLILVVTTLVAYWQVQHHGFVNYDDTQYVTNNPSVQDGLTVEGIIWAFTTGHVSNWHPLTWLSHMLDCHLYGLSPGGHHLTNVLFHIANTVLLFFVFRFMTGALWRPAIVAALFALHPLHVESVAWVAERKDVLSTLFWLLTMFAYAWYVKRPGVSKCLVVITFALGLMAKPMLVTLPFVLLLIDYWPLRRFGVGVPSMGNSGKGRWNLVWEKWPLFLISAGSSIVTFLVQQRGLAVQPLELIPMGSRLANAVVSYASYIWKMVWPARLSVYYPHPLDSLTKWQILGAALLLVSISAVVLREIKRRPYLIVGWLWFLGTLVPVIGIVQVGGQAMADRYTYVPMIGLFIALTWGASDIVTVWPKTRSFLGVAVAVIISILAVRTSFQVRHWKNTTSLFGHALQVTIGNQLAHNQLGLALLKDGNTDEAIKHFSEALRITPQYVNAHVNLGNAFKDKEDFNRAAQQYRRALSFAPGHATARNNLGILMARQGRTEEAVAHFSQVLQRDPNNARTHNNMGIVLAKQGKLDDAIVHFSQVLRVDPNHVEAHYNLGIALARKGRLNEAAEHFSEAVRIRPDFTKAKNYLEQISQEMREP